MNRKGVWTHKNDVERPVPLHTSLERVHRKLTVLRDLDLVTVLLEDLYSELLVHQVVFGDQDVVWHIVLGHDWRDRI